MASLFGCTSSIFSFILFLVFAPIFLVLWLLFTITGIGPLLNVFYSRRDKALLDALIKPSASPEGRDGLAAATGGGSGQSHDEGIGVRGRCMISSMCLCDGFPLCPGHVQGRLWWRRSRSRATSWP
jgi:hypothetical protein